MRESGERGGRGWRISTHVYSRTIKVQVQVPGLVILFLLTIDTSGSRSTFHTLTRWCLPNFAKPMASYNQVVSYILCKVMSGDGSSYATGASTNINTKSRGQLRSLSRGILVKRRRREGLKITDPRFKEGNNLIAIFVPL